MITPVLSERRNAGVLFSSWQGHYPSGKVDTVELKVEAIHAYQKQAQAEIMDKLFESNEITGQAHNALEKRIARIEKHLGLPPLK